MTRVKLSRPRIALLGLTVLGVLLAGCGPTTDTAGPAADPTTAIATTAATADPTTAAADPVVTDDPTAAAAPPATKPPATTAAKPAATKKPTTRPTTRKPTSKPTTTKPTPKPSSTKAPTGAFVHPGAFCAPEGKIGYTSKGTRMRCTRKAGEPQARWRAA